MGQNVHSRVGVGSCSQAEEGAGRDPNPHLPRQKQKLEAHWGGTPPPPPPPVPHPRPSPKQRHSRRRALGSVKRQREETLRPLRCKAGPQSTRSSSAQELHLSLGGRRPHWPGALTCSRCTCRGLNGPASGQQTVPHRHLPAPVRKQQAGMAPTSPSSLRGSPSGRISGDRSTTSWSSQSCRDSVCTHAR